MFTMLTIYANIISTSTYYTLYHTDTTDTSILFGSAIFLNNDKYKVSNLCNYNFP